MKTFLLNISILLVLAGVNPHPMWSEENEQENEFLDEFQDVDEDNQNGEENSFENINTQNRYHDAPYPEFGSMFDSDGYNRFGGQNQFDRSQGNEDNDGNYDGGYTENNYARDEGFSNGYHFNRRGGSSRGLKRKPTRRIKKPTKLRFPNQPTGDYSRGGGMSNFGNGEHNQNVFHMYQK